MKQRQYRFLNKDSLKTVLNHQNSYDESKKDKAFYQNISTLYFQLGDYDNSIKNIEKVLVLDSLNATAIFIKATIEEKKGNFSQAIVLYDKVAALTKNDAILIYSALAKRKKNTL